MKVYLDNNATTPVDPQVLQAMLPYFCEKFGNAASRSHAWGWEAEEAVKLARQQIANVIGAEPEDIIFTSGATEGNNIALKGVAAMYADKGKHIITQPTEHKAVIDPAKWLATEAHGFRVTFLHVDGCGRIDLGELRDAIKDDTILVSIMHGNNEVGTLQPIAEIGKLCKEKGVLFHTDCCQTFGKLPIDVNAMGIDLLTCSGHKIYGPKGIGALYVRRKRPRVRCEPVLHGGGHERGMRSGTLNVPGIVGFGAACNILRQEGLAEQARIALLRDRLQSKLQHALRRVSVNGDPAHRLPNNLNMSFHHVEGEGLMLALKDIAVSSGSACTSAELEPSHVLAAMGVDPAIAHSSIRFGIGRFNTEEEIDYVAGRVISEVSRLRDMSPLWEMVEKGVDPASIHWVAS